MKSEDLHIQRILDALGKIEKFLAGKSQPDLESDEMLYDAVLMELMVIGKRRRG